VDDITMHVGKGEIFGIIDPNVAGNILVSRGNHHGFLGIWDKILKIALIDSAENIIINNGKAEGGNVGRWILYKSKYT
jgi:hypothetical protein